jgi:hypothetical protein
LSFMALSINRIMGSNVEDHIPVPSGPRPGLAQS